MLLASCAALRPDPGGEPPNDPPLRRWAEDVAGTPLPETATSIGAFQQLSTEQTFADALRVVGPPVRERRIDPEERAGVIHVYVWDLDGGDQIQIGTPDLQALQFVDLISHKGKHVRLAGK